MVSIVENYKQYVPPKAARKSVERLLSSLPSGNLTGVEAIVLTNSSTLGKGKTKRVRGRKYPENRCLGFYHPNARDSGPWIELVVDNIVGEAPPFFLRWRLLSDFMFASTLYHEIGHHLDATIGSPAKTGEQAAEAWMKKLRTGHFKKRYRLLFPAMRLLHTIFEPRLNRKLDEIKRELRQAPPSNSQ